jgi:hypothetical protein
MKILYIFIAGASSAAVLSCVLTFVSHNTDIQNSYCASLEAPTLREDIQPTIRRDCLGALDREQFAKSFLFLLPFMIVAICVNEDFYIPLRR